MSMSSSGNTRHTVSEINVTPLIDVLLVLLIIFMVIMPVAPKGLRTVIPQPPKDAPLVSPSAAIVVQVEVTEQGEPSYRINQTLFPKSQIEAKLTAIFATRQEKLLFVKGDSSLEFNKIAEVIDMGHRANVDHIGIITPRISSNQ